MSSVQLFELIIGMFLAVLVLQYLALRLRLPPAVALLVGGGALAFVPSLPAIRLDPELVLVISLPPLLMDGAWFTALDRADDRARPALGRLPRAGRHRAPTDSFER